LRSTVGNYPAEVNLTAGKAGLAEVIVGGGGTKTPPLMAMLKEALALISVLTFESFDLDSKAIEAMAFLHFWLTKRFWNTHNRQWQTAPAFRRHG
jgi:1,6-anhydro-N-acetylmuramate kinase